MNFIDDVELNNYLVKLDYNNEIIKEYRDNFIKEFNSILSSYKTNNNSRLNTIFSNEINNINTIISDNNYYKVIIERKINTYKNASQFVENKFKDI